MMGFLLAMVLMAAGIAWAVLLPNLTRCPSCPPFVACSCVTDSRIPLLTLIAGAGSFAAYLSIRMTRPRASTAP